MISDELLQLAATVADWASEAPACIVYIFGSYVRGDQHAGSDLDICMPIPSPVDDETFGWLAEQSSNDYEDLKVKLPMIKILGTAGNQNEKIIAARVVPCHRVCCICGWPVKSEPVADRRVSWRCSPPDAGGKVRSRPALIRRCARPLRGAPRVIS